MSQPIITIEKALTIFQNNFKGDYKIILTAPNNTQPDALGYHCEFYTAKSLLKFIAKEYGKQMVDFELTFEPGTKLFPSQILRHLQLMEKHLDQIKDNLYEAIGDPGNDIGDSGTILELISNLITEGHYDEDEKLFLTIIGETEGINLSKEEMRQIFTYFELALSGDNKKTKTINEWVTKF